MPLYEFPNMSSGMDHAIVDTVTAVPSFIPMFLAFVFGVVFLGGMTAQRKREGNADPPLWAALGSLAALFISLPLTLSAGIIHLETLAIVVTVTVISGFWLFMDRR